MNKTDCRKYYIALRKKQTENERKKATSKIMAHILTMDEYQKAERVMCFVSFQSEVDTFGLLSQMLYDGKKVAVPYCYANTDEMCACSIESLEDLVEGKHGILAPKWPEKVMDPSQLDLIFVPGLAFDEKGYRLGYGRGYYDRFLQKKAEKTDAIGLGFACQFEKSIPHEEHDERLDMFICEEGIWRF